MRQQWRRLYLDRAAICPMTLAAALALPRAEQMVEESDCGVPCTTGVTMDANIEALLSYRGAQAIGQRALALIPATEERMLTGSMCSR